MKQSPFQRLWAYDRKVRKSRPSGCRLVGIDEVGRGSLIGPVVAAAVVLPETLDKETKSILAHLNDSKQVKREMRELLSQHLEAIAHVGIGVAEKDEVDTLNVYHASLLAFTRAYAEVCQKTQTQICHEADFLLIDGRAKLPDIPITQQQAVIKGDGTSASIAAASIIAKVYRDNLVIKMAESYPGYGWETNMGYGTPDHLAGLDRLGITPHHRINFRCVANAQLSLELASS